MKWRRLLLFVVASLLCLSPALSAKDGLKVWTTGDYNVLGIRGSVQFDGNVEIGGLSEWRPWESEKIPQVFGIFGLYHLPGEVPISELPLFNWLPPDVNVASYIGLQGGVEANDDDEDRGFYGPLVGVVLNKFIFDDVDDEIETGVEFQYVNYTDQLERDIDRNDEIRVTFFAKISF